MNILCFLIAGFILLGISVSLDANSGFGKKRWFFTLLLFVLLGIGLASPHFCSIEKTIYPDIITIKVNNSYSYQICDYTDQNGVHHHLDVCRMFQGKMVTAKRLKVTLYSPWAWGWFYCVKSDRVRLETDEEQ